MELDTGAPCSIIAEETLRLIKPLYTLQPSDRQFSSYTGHRVTCVGRLKVQVTIGMRTRSEQLYVVSGVSDSLLGREWISHFADQINLNELFSAQTPIHSIESTLTPDREKQLARILDSFSSVFSDSPGKLVGPPAKVHLKQNASPVFAKARDVPHALRERYAEEIEKKIRSGFYEKVDYSEWASPTHVVVKKNGKLRITGNYKPTVNPLMIVDEHPILRIEDIFNRMKGATLFCHLDVTDAYTHLPIDEQFRQVLTLNTTTHGLIRPTRAVYGAANIPAIWQRRMEEVLRGLTNVVSFFDDIIVFAKDFDELLQIQQLPIKAEQIARETRKDQHLGKILKDLEMGRDLQQTGYKAPEAKYTTVANCLLFEHRVVIPDIFRSAILQDLHVAHIGVVKMKSLATSYVYWPGIDKDIEQLAKSCHECAQTASASPKFNKHHWEYPSNAWERVHIDYAGPVADAMLLIIVDAYSKWVEVKVTHSTTTEATIKILDDIFASYGAPVTVVTDNGPQFTSEDFSNFLQRSGVKFHKRSAPYHPATNGQAERYVQTVKRALKAMHSTSATLQANLNKFLLQYRKVPHSETGEPPAKLFLGRNIRSRIDLVCPQSVQSRTAEKQRCDLRPSYRTFVPGQLVYCLSGNPRKGKWIRGTVVTRLGDLHYTVECDGIHIKRHVDQIRPALDDNKPVNQRSVSGSPQPPEVHHRRHYYGSTQPQQVPDVAPRTVPVSSESSDSACSSSSSTTSESPYGTPIGSPTPIRDTPFSVRRSTRQRTFTLLT
uniref:RNA-directed DNA polymerase n=1 Tax=Anopheles stephensi TaxID=30069 RepID=A0A182YS55_ANOST